MAGSDQSTDGTEQIKIERAVLMRLRSQKAHLDNQQDAPDHTLSGYISYLLDTEEAARNGYYEHTKTDQSGDGDE